MKNTCKVKKRNKLSVIITQLMLVAVLSIFCSTHVLANSQTNEGTIAQFVKENAPIVDQNGAVVREGSDQWVGSISSHFQTKASATAIKSVTAIDSSGNSTTYYYAESDSAIIVQAISDIKESDKVQSKIDDMTNDLGIEADTKSAVQSLSGVTPVANYIVGIIVLLIDVGLMLYTAFDICYLLFPVLRMKMQDNLAEGKGINVRSQDGENKYRFVSDEAVNAYQASAMGESKKAPYTKYFISRLWAYIAVAVLTFILLTGNISIITQAALKLASGALNLFESLF